MLRSAGTNVALVRRWRPNVTDCLSGDAALHGRWGVLPMRSRRAGHRLTGMSVQPPVATVATSSNRRDHLGVDTATGPGLDDVAGLLERSSELSCMHACSQEAAERQRGHVVLV